MKNVENFTTNSSNNSFDNHIILITGSSKGLGLSLAKYFSTKNCELIITGSNKESLKNAMETLQNHSKLKAKINGIILDLETYESIDDFYNKIKSNYKRIDIFVNCAYKKTSKSNLTNTNAKEFMKAINVNINGTFYLTQKIIKIMKSNGSGKIFFISSPSSKARDTLVYKSADILSKNTLERMTDILSYENYRQNIGICTIRIDNGVFNDNEIDTNKVKNKTLKRIYKKTNEIMANFTNHPDEFVRYIVPVFKMPIHQINGKLYTTNMLIENSGELSKIIPQTQINLKNYLYNTSQLSKFPKNNQTYVNKQNPYKMSSNMEKFLKSYNYATNNKNIKSKYPKPLANQIAKLNKISSDQIVFFKDEYTAIKKILGTISSKYDGIITVYPISEKLHFITTELKMDMKYTVFKTNGKSIQPKYTHILNQITPKTKVIYLSNPNSLTGQCIKKTEFESFLEKVPDNVFIIIDESYIDMVTKNNKEFINSVDYLDKNVIVLRSFSHSCGYANLELVYAIGSVKIMEIFEDSNIRFNQIDQFTQDLALVSFNDKSYRDKLISKIVSEKEKMYKAFDDSDVSYYPSDCNYILIDASKTQEDILKEAESNNIIIEHENSFYNNYWSLPLSTPEINNQILDILVSKY